MTAARLLTLDDVGAEPVPEWVGASLGEFRELVLGPPAHPCHFGVDGEEKRVNRYSWVEGPPYDDPAEMQALGATMWDFLKHTVEPDPTIRRSLVVFCSPHERSRRWETAFADFWEVLRGLHGADAAPWPPAVPTDPRDGRWEFCFGGEPLFVFGCAPAFELRRSRSVSSGLVLVFQSKRVFTRIEGTTAAGRAAKRLIRSRLADFDRIGPHAALGDGATSSSHKWRQYFLPDDDTTYAGECPFWSPQR